jgi:phosphate transport system protein
MARDGFHQELQEIHEITIGMASLIERALAQAAQALMQRDRTLARKVRAEDGKIDELLHTIRIRCTEVAARHAPVGGDLRELTVAQLVASELERMGDHASAIAKRTLELPDDAPRIILGDLGELAKVVRGQVHDGVLAFVSGDEQAARAVCQGDDAVDKLYKALFSDLITYMESGGESARIGTSLLFAAHDFERIGDRMTNICEDVIYLATGQIVELN